MKNKTDSTRLHARIKKTNKAADELNNEISLLFHDIKMPLSNIIAAYACLKKSFDRFCQYLPPDSPELEKIIFSLEILKKSSSKLDRMLSCFIESHINNTPRLSKNNLKEMLKNLTELYQNSYSYGVKTFELHYSVKEEYFVFDKDKITSVFDNLLSNAAKYTEEGMVIIEVTGNNEYVSIAFKDSGIGIHEDDLPHIFKLGYQGKNHSQKDSFGIGLYNVKNIIEQHGGTIEITSRLNRGTAIKVNLPLLHKKT